MTLLKQLITSPLSLSVIGWIAVPLVFMVMTMAIMLGVTIELVFWLLSPFWLAGVVSWLLAIFTGLFFTVLGPNRKDGFLGLLFSATPFALAYIGALYFSSSLGNVLF